MSTGFRAPGLDARRLIGVREFLIPPHGGYLIKNLDPGAAILVFFGPPKAGKTYTVLDLSLHAAHGRDWHGFRVCCPLKVAYLVGEGTNGFRLRLKAWHEEYGPIDDGQFMIYPYCASLPAESDEVIAALARFEPDIVVCDTLNVYFGAGDENATRDMTAFCDALRHIRDSLRCSVWVIHHTGHAAQGRERGSIVLRASADVMVQIGKGEDGGENIGFQVLPSRDVQPMDDALSLRLEWRPIAWLDSDGEPLGACVVRNADVPVALPGRGGKPLGEHQATVLALIRDQARKASASADNGAGEILVSRHVVRDAAKGMDRRRFSDALQALSRRGVIRLVEPDGIYIRR